MRTRVRGYPEHIRFHGFPSLLSPLLRKSVRKITAGISRSLACINSTTVPESSSPPSKLNSQIARDYPQQILVPNINRAVCRRFHVLRKNASETPPGQDFDELAQQSVTDELFVIEQRTGEIDCVFHISFHSIDPRASISSCN